MLIVALLFIAVIFTNTNINTPVYKWDTISSLQNRVLSYENIKMIIVIGLIFFVLSSVAIVASGGSIKRYTAGFGFIFLTAVSSLIIAGNKTIYYYGVEYVVFALIAGLLMSNLFHFPLWLKDAARSEFFIKTGLVLLGTSILFTDIIKAGFPGIMQSIIVVAVVWFFSLWLSRMLKVDDEFGVLLASAVSICGVSAAIVASGAFNGDKKNCLT